MQISKPVLQYPVSKPRSASIAAESLLVKRSHYCSRCCSQACKLGQCASKSNKPLAHCAGW